MTTKSKPRSPRPRPGAGPKTGAAPEPMPRELFRATTTPDAVMVPARTVLALDGQGAPEGERFQHSIAAIFGIAYTLKFTRKKASRRDFKICPLETRWWSDDPAGRFLEAPRDTWRWQLRMAVPRDVTPAELTAVIQDATRKRGGKLEGSLEAARVTVTVLPAARYGRVLHIGPYANEAESFARIVELVDGAGLVAHHAHLEVYLSDPRRTKPEKLKTVLLLELI